MPVPARPRKQPGGDRDRDFPAGIRGALAAWTGFTLPSAVALILFAYGVTALKGAVAQAGWTGKDLFLAGYGAAQAVPGPLFTFSAYLGAVMHPEPSGWVGGLICLVAIFLPSFLLLLGILPFWEKLHRVKVVRSALMGGQCGGCLVIACSVLRHGLDQRYSLRERLRSWPNRLWTPCPMENPAMARCHV
jgi:chromate transport protein ChrA